MKVRALYLFSAADESQKNMAEGEEFTAVQLTGDWVLVNDGGNVGWVPALYLSPTCDS